MLWRSQKTDDELMREIAGGNQSAFAHLFDRHSRKVLGYAMRLMGGDKIRAEDISQIAWMKLVKAAPAYEGSNNFVAWLYTLVRNTAFNELRSKRRRNEEELNESTVETLTVESVESELMKGSDAVKLKRYIDELPEMQRAVLVSFLTEEMSYDEIASQLDISVSSVKSLLFRARTNLASRMRGQL